MLIEQMKQEMQQLAHWRNMNYAGIVPKNISDNGFAIKTTANILKRSIRPSSAKEPFILQNLKNYIETHFRTKPFSQRLCRFTQHYAKKR